MSKAIRFSELVNQSGKPETVTLWMKPKDNPQLMKAVRENRVLTLIQKPSGANADFGEIGFHQKPFALYLIFPKRLPATDSHVIGIKYDLFEEQTVQKSSDVEPRVKKVSKPPKIIAPLKPKPIPPNKFNVTILRSAIQEITLTVDAKDLHEAETRALELAEAQKFVATSVENEIKAIAER